ncbi:AraC family transcriptional regulator [Hanstruepera neustonica]|uniref:AraC family transcriptional regulator n=1 Tax=Hanstruepera neustonica TaxID=1445657 RepID=A0A2K1E4B6_9FLAO|nr:AraC family transcriptional regulator [Hanstruepera neustonica]PNQ75129.1 AraC family transcriptional regulator [Hanstruepera neustonica]
MKVLPFKIPKPETHAFVFQIDKEVVFYDKLHQHEDIQISYILVGEGALVVGDTITHYKSGDIIVIGGNLPHVFKSEPSTKQSHMLSIFFTKDAFGKTFFELPELSQTKPFFKRCKQGFKLTTNIRPVQERFLMFEKTSKIEQFILLLEIMKLASSAGYKSLSSFIYEKTYSDNEGKRMQDVVEYTMNNYKNNISLDSISEIANMTKNAFCKYFKKRTNKTYIQFLNELRIEQAQKLLQSDTDLSITEIAELCGFNNISHFNRQFKAIKKTSPSKIKNK